MDRLFLTACFVFACSCAHAITATKAYVDGATNATLIAAKAYTDEHGGGGGGVNTNSVNELIRSYDATNLTARIGSKADRLTDFSPGKFVRISVDGNIEDSGYDDEDFEPRGEAAVELQFHNSSEYAHESLFESKADVATTLEGYGIADAYTMTEVDDSFAKKSNQGEVGTIGYSFSYPGISNGVYGVVFSQHSRSSLSSERLYNNNGWSVTSSSSGWRIYKHSADKGVIATSNMVNSIVPMFISRSDANFSNEVVAVAGGGGGSVSPSYSWVRPNDWTVDYVVSNSYENITTVVAKVSGYRIYSNGWERVTQFRSGRAFTMHLDPTAEKPLSVDNWSAVSQHNITINQDGSFTASNDGLYRIMARIGSTTKYADIAVQQFNDITNEYVYYAGDVDATVRRQINDTALQTLDAAVTYAVKTNGEGYVYRLYPTFVPRMTSPYAGNVSAWAVSAHVLASANHYGNKVLGNQTFSDGTTSATVTKIQWVRLADWALTNGFSEAEIAAAEVSDIALIRCSKSSAVPNGCIPYFISPLTSERWFGGTLEGVTGWAFCQDSNQAIPVVLTGSSNFTFCYNNAYESWSRRDIMNRLNAMGNQYNAYSGDSGKPVFVMYNGNPVIITAIKTITYGPNYIAGFRMIKAFVEAYGDQLKEAN